MEVVLQQILTDKTKRNELATKQVVYNVSSASPW